MGLVPPGQLGVNTLKKPVEGAGSAAMIGAGQGAVGTLSVLGYGGCSGGPFACALGFALGVALSPVGALVGAGVGAARSHPAEAVRNAQEAISSVLNQTRPNEELALAFTKCASETYGRTIVPISLTPASSGSEPAQEAKPKYALRLQYESFEFHAAGRIDPDINLDATVSADIVLLADLKPVYQRTWGYESQSHGYFELAKDNGAALRRLIDMSENKIASTVARDLFEENEPRPVGKPKEGTVWTKSGPAPSSPVKNGTTAPYSPPALAKP